MVGYGEESTMLGAFRGSLPSDPYDAFRDDQLQGDDLGAKLERLSKEVLGPEWFEQPNDRLDWESPREAVEHGRQGEVKQILRSIIAGGAT
jgi:hypothetical protein